MVAPGTSDSLTWRLRRCLDTWTNICSMGTDPCTHAHDTHLLLTHFTRTIASTNIKINASACISTVRKKRSCRYSSRSYLPHPKTNKCKRSFLLEPTLLANVNVRLRPKIYTVFGKTRHFYSLNSSVNFRSIVIFFGVQHREETLRKWL